MSETIIGISEIGTIAAAIGAVVAAIGAVVAAIGSLLSARATKKTAEAELYSRFLTEYSSEEMLEALRVLIEWKKTYGDGFESEWISALKDKTSKHYKKAYKVDIARRRVKYYFFKALMFYERGYVKHQFLKSVGELSGINIVYDIVEPLEKALNPQYIKAAEFERLKKLCPRIDVEVHYIPPA